jgi:hypothetical protein
MGNARSELALFAPVSSSSAPLLAAFIVIELVRSPPRGVAISSPSAGESEIISLTLCRLKREAISIVGPTYRIGAGACRR